MERTVLVVEDSPVVRRLLVAMLEILGHTVVEASDGRLAWEWLRNAPAVPAVVVSDLSMPEVDGWQLLRLIRDQPALEAVPFLLVTANPDDPRAHRVRATRWTGVCTKPVTLAGLGIAIGSLLDAPANR